LVSNLKKPSNSLRFFLYHRIMNEELAMQHSAQNQYQPEPKRNPWVRRIVMTLVILVLVGGIGFGGALAGQQYTDVNSKLSSEQTKNQELKTQNTLLQKQVADASATLEITDTLPSGKTMTYADTPGNRNILWWNASAASTDSNYIRLSHKAYQQYMSSTDATLLTKVCGSGTDITDLSYGLFDTATKKITLPQNQSCLDTMASVTNTDAASRAAAQKVVDQIKTDIDAFTAAVTIQ
jgi:cell division protein FtsB